MCQSNRGKRVPKARGGGGERCGWRKASAAAAECECRAAVVKEQMRQPWQSRDRKNKSCPPSPALLSISLSFWFTLPLLVRRCCQSGSCFARRLPFKAGHGLIAMFAEDSRSETVPLHLTHRRRLMACLCCIPAVVMMLLGTRARSSSRFLRFCLRSLTRALILVLLPRTEQKERSWSGFRLAIRSNNHLLIRRTGDRQRDAREEGREE